MAIELGIKVDDLETVLQTYNTIKILRSTDNETFSEITAPSTRPVLNTQDNLYMYTDSTGTEDHFYRTTFFHSSTSAESAQSATFKGTTDFNQLLHNMQIVITIDKSIANTSGVSLTEDIEFYFTTKYNPLYSSIRRIRLDIGKFIEGIPDDTINLAIFEASREADFLTFIKDASKHTELYKHARRQWSTCKAEQILLSNAYSASGGLLKSKRLGDFSVEYDRGLIDDISKRIQDCIARWEAEVNSGGAALQTPTMVIKGELDPDRPDSGRDWRAADGYPVGNAKIKPAGSRKFFTTYYTPKSRWNK